MKRMERRGEFTFARVSDGLSNDEVQLVIPKDVCENGEFFFFIFRQIYLKNSHTLSKSSGCVQQAAPAEASPPKYHRPTRFSFD